MRSGPASVARGCASRPLRPGVSEGVLWRARRRDPTLEAELHAAREFWFERNSAAGLARCEASARDWIHYFGGPARVEAEAVVARLLRRR